MAHIEHIVGKGNYEDVIKKALHPNAGTEAKVFDDNFPISWYVDAYASFVTQLEYLYWNRNEYIIRHILVDAQDFMFGNLFEPQRVMTDIGFEYRGEELGGEIIVYRAGNVVLYLHGMPSIASDSRKSIKWSRKHMRAIALDAIKGGIELGTGEIEYAEEMTVCNILGAMYAENMVCGGHGSLLFASAVQRDLLMPTGFNAIDLYRGSLTIDDINYPCTQKARRQWTGPKMPNKWWLLAPTQDEAVTKHWQNRQEQKEQKRLKQQKRQEQQEQKRQEQQEQKRQEQQERKRLKQQKRQELKQQKRQEQESKKD